MHYCLAPLPSGIDVIIRCHDPSRLHELDRALFSLANQSLGPVRPIMVAQNFSDDQRREIERLLRAYRWSGSEGGPLVVDVTTPPGVDLRSRLINEGFARARHRFIAILDYDDLLLERAYETLVGDLLSSRAAVSFGRVVVKYVRVYDSSVYTVRTLTDMYRGLDLKDLLRENFCPIHSFVIDRCRVSPDELRFDETISRLEDYDFLLRMSSTCRLSFSQVTTPVGIYNWRLDGSNSIQSFEQDPEKSRLNQIEWDRARRHIDALKGRIFFDARSLKDPKSLSPTDLDDLS